MKDEEIARDNRLPVHCRHLTSRRHCIAIPVVAESLRGNRIGARGLRACERKSASERVSERVSEREGFQRFLRGFERFLVVFRGFERFSEFLRGFQRLLRGFQRSSQRPSQRQISSQSLSVLLPLIVLPLELSPKSPRKCRYPLFAYPLFKPCPKLNPFKTAPFQHSEKGLCQECLCSYWPHSRRTGTVLHVQCLARRGCS